MQRCMLQKTFAGKLSHTYRKTVFPLTVNHTGHKPFQLRYMKSEIILMGPCNLSLTSDKLMMVSVSDG